MKTLKQILVILTTIIILLITSNGEVNASLQSNPNTQYTKYDSVLNWMNKIRKMETEGETMGLSETLNEDLTASSESNNIDVHMIRSTEYGATAILSASGYGNPSKENAITTTTGNDTGVIINTLTTGEMVAGGLPKELSNGYRSVFSPEIVNIRYYDSYLSKTESSKVGDALGTATTSNPGCFGWHGASISGFTWVNGEMPYFVRGSYGIFSIVAHYDFKGSHPRYSRGVVVCGEGI